MKGIRKVLAIFCLLLGIIVTVPLELPTFQNIAIVEAATVKINKKKATLYVGDTLQLKVTGTKKTVKWSSNKKSVATVSKKGKVKAKNEGTATITAKVGNKKLTCKITVKEDDTTTNEIKINTSEKTLKVGETHQLNIIGTKEKVTWKSGNRSIVTVDSNGEILGESVGRTWIVGEVNENKYFCTVTVEESANKDNTTNETTNSNNSINDTTNNNNSNNQTTNTNQEQSTQQLYINTEKDYISIEEGKNVQLYVLSNCEMISTISSDISIANAQLITKNGVYHSILVTGNKAGTTTIIIKDNNSTVFKMITVNVYAKAEQSYINIDKNVVTVKQGENVQIAVSSNCKNLYQTSNNTTIAEAQLTAINATNYTLTITGKNAGTSIITVTDNSITKIVTIIVEKKIEESEDVIDTKEEMNKNENIENEKNELTKEEMLQIIASKQTGKLSETYLNNYRTSTSEKRNNIVNLQKQIASLSFSDDRTIVAKRQKLETQLTQLEKELEKEQYEYSIKLREAGLDELLSEYSSNYEMCTLIREEKAKLQNEQKIHEYELKITEKEEEITVLEKQIAVLADSTYQPNIAQRLKLEEQLAKKKEELKSLQNILLSYKK